MRLTCCFRIAHRRLLHSIDPHHALKEFYQRDPRDQSIVDEKPSRPVEVVENNLPFLHQVISSNCRIAQDSMLSFEIHESAHQNTIIPRHRLLIKLNSHRERIALAHAIKKCYHQRFAQQSVQVEGLDQRVSDWIAVNIHHLAMVHIVDPDSESCEALEDLLMHQSAHHDTIDLESKIKEFQFYPKRSLQAKPKLRQLQA